MLQVLQDQEGLAVQKCEGRVGPHPPHTWALWSRYTFKLSQACRLELDLQVAGEALLKATSLVLLDNDTSQVLPLLRELLIELDHGFRVYLNPQPLVCPPCPFPLCHYTPLPIHSFTLSA